MPKIGKAYFWGCTMRSAFIETGTERLHYLQWGSGKKLLLALHGYSNHAGMFAPMAEWLKDKYTIVSLDMPYHGKSEWGTELPWTKAELLATVKALMAAKGVDTISLTGFSLGGRVCLMLAELMPQHIERMTLIAPDGLVPNRFYQFVTGNAAGKRIFSHFLTKPEGYMRVIAWLQERHIVPAAKRKLVEQYVTHEQSRAFLRKVWPNLRLLVPDQQKVRKHIAEYHIATHLFMGKYDRVIPLEHAQAFAAGEPFIKVHILDKGHRVMDDGSVLQIAQSLLIS
jgi:pimeloyl-ACP methyl ester carboxylesterase